MSETFRNAERRSRVTLLVSEEARERMAKFAKRFHSYQYDMIETFAIIFDPDDPHIEELIAKNIRKLPESIQYWYAIKLFNDEAKAKEKEQGNG